MNCRLIAIRCLVMTALAISLVSMANPTLAASATERVRMRFNLGIVDIDLYGNESPDHVNNFLLHVNSNNYDDSIIHRTDSPNPLAPVRFIQGGSFKVPSSPVADQSGLASIISENSTVAGPLINNEFDPSNGLSNTPYTLAAAQGATNQGGVGWFINVTDNSGGVAAFDAQEFTVYGEVLVGREILDQMLTLPRFDALSGTFFESAPKLDEGLVIIEQAWQIPTVPGDYNLNDVNDIGDYDAWVGHFGSRSELVADGNENSLIDAPDYTFWRDLLVSAGAASRSVPHAANIPEPSSLSLLILAACFGGWRSRRR